MVWEPILLTLKSQQARHGPMDLKTERGLELFYELVAQIGCGDQQLCGGGPWQPQDRLLSILPRSTRKSSPLHHRAALVSRGQAPSEPGLRISVARLCGGMSLTGPDSEHPKIARPVIPLAISAVACFGIMWRAGGAWLSVSFRWSVTY